MGKLMNHPTVITVVTTALDIEMTDTAAAGAAVPAIVTTNQVLARFWHTQSIPKSWAAIVIT